MSTKVAGVRLKTRESICRSSKHSTEDEFQGKELERKECFCICRHNRGTEEDYRESRDPSLPHC